MSTSDGVRIRRLDALGERELAGLCDVLIDCVEGGASVSFMHPLSRERAVAFWRRVGDGVAAGERAPTRYGDWERKGRAVDF